MGGRPLPGGVVDPARDRQGEDQHIERDMRRVGAEPLQRRIAVRHGRRRVGEAPQEPQHRQAQHGQADRLVGVDGGADPVVRQAVGDEAEDDVADDQHGDDPVQRHGDAGVAGVAPMLVHGDRHGVPSKR